MRILCIQKGTFPSGVPIPEVGSDYEAIGEYQTRCACGCTIRKFYDIPELSTFYGYETDLFAVLPGVTDEEMQESDVLVAEGVLESQ